MTGPEHFEAAQRLLAEASFTDAYGNAVRQNGRTFELFAPGAHQALIARAQVHATLALAAATFAVNLPISDGAWREVAGPQSDGDA